MVAAVNGAGCDVDGPLHVWASYHYENFPIWMAQRRERAFPDAEEYWTSRHLRQTSAPERLPYLHRGKTQGGSSSLLAVDVALGRAERVVLAGIPLSEGAHYDDDVPFVDYLAFRRDWLRVLPSLTSRVRSMSGWTREVLGEPTEDWLRSGSARG